MILGAAAPVFADSRHDRGFEQNRHSYRGYDRHGYRDYDRNRVVVVQRPYVVERAYVVERPVYYSEPAPNIGIAAMIGAAIGGYIDNRQ